MPSLLGRANPKDLAPGEALIPLGMSDGRWWLIVSGVLIVETTSANGRRSIMEFLGPNDVIEGIEAPEAGWVTRALTPCRLLGWPAGFVPDAIRRDPALGAWVHDRQSARLDRAHRALARTLGLSVSERLEGVLWHLASLRGQPVADGMRIEIPVDQETLAAAVGATREHVNRILRTMRSEGRIRRTDGRYTLVSPSAQTDLSRRPRGKPFLPAPVSAGEPGPIALRRDGARADSRDR